MLQKRASIHVYKSFSRLNHSTYSNSSKLKPHKTSNFIVYCNTQITANGRSGNIKEAESIFNRMPDKNTISWTAMLTAYAQNGQIEKARKLFDEIPERTTASFNAMITAYVKSHCNVDKAYDLFAKMPEHNPLSYGAMITGFVKSGMFDRAEELYVTMPVEWRDPVCSNALISGYLKVGRVEDAVQVFEGMAERDVVSWSSMVDGYCKKGKVAEARTLFDRMPEKNVVTWTAMIDGYMKLGCFEDGFGLFLSMRRGVVVPNSTTLTTLSDACGNFCRYREGIQIHGLVYRMGFDFDIVLGNSILKMYCRFSSVDDATKIFSMMSKKDVLSWNCLISGYVNNNKIEEAYILFKSMPLEKDMFTWTTMVTGFSNEGNTEKSMELFRMMPEKDHIAWTAVISGCVTNEQYEEAFRLFIEMLQKEIRPNEMSLSSMLSASSGLATLAQGSQVHALVIKMNMEFELSIQNSLVSMYSKCGSVADAYGIFTNIIAPNIVSFNSMITGFAQNGMGNEALDLFRKMNKEGLGPNQITFLGVLSACTHVGLVEEGLKHFKSMKSVYDIEPGPDHYACMVDLLGRAGLLDEAIDLIDSMPFKPHAGVWGALLGASRTHLDLDLAKLAAQHLIELEPDNGTPYVVLSNLYYIVGKQRDGDQVRMTRKSKGIRKSPGCSWIILKDKVHLFLAGEQSLTSLEEIKVVLWTVSREIREIVIDND